MTPERFHIDHRDVHIWTVVLGAPQETVHRFGSFLSANEKARNDRFRFDYLRREFTLRRGALRILLGNYLGVPPEQTGFTYNSYGKPYAAGASGIQFNASHSRDLALFAFTRDCELGVDIETP